MIASHRLLWTCAAVLAFPWTRLAPAQHSLWFGSGGLVTVDDDAPVQGQQAVEIEFWYRTSSAVKKPVHLVSRWSAASDSPDPGAFYIGFENATRLRFGVRNARGVVVVVGGRVPRADDAWHHVTASFDTQSLVLRLDGAELEREPLGDFGTLAATKQPLRVGPSRVKQSKIVPAFDGYLSELRIWSRTRDSIEIRSQMRTELKGDERGLRTYLPLRVPIPDSRARNLVVGQPSGRLSSELAQRGWTLTSSCLSRVPPGLSIHCIDLEDVVGRGRKILVSRGKKGKDEAAGILWQPERGTPRLMWLGERREKILELEGKGVLAAGTTDEDGNAYYLMIEPQPVERDESAKVVATLHKVDATEPGKAKRKPRRGSKDVRTRVLDTTRPAFNLWSYGGRWHGNMRYHAGVLGLILPRTMYRSNDGLRHQSAIAVTFSAKTLEVSRMLGTTSSHSMGNVLTLGAKGGFLGLDLGDNYPRGLHLHRFTSKGKASRVVFTYKTAHATRPRNGSPVYDAISGDGATFYKWSNDNATYSELGGVIEQRKRYVVVFSTDQSPTGKVLDNSRAFRGCTDARNLAMLFVDKSLGKGGRGSVIPDSVMASLPKGSTAEEGGFYDFGGRWTPQRVPGVYWLTQYEPGESAHAPQLHTLRDGGFLMLWEKSTAQGSRSIAALRIDKRGRKGAIAQVQTPLRLSREDRMLRVGTRLCFLGELDDGRTRLYFVRDA